MKQLLIALAAVVLGAQALPTPEQKSANNFTNVSFFSLRGQPIGFASRGLGTQGGGDGAVWTVWDAFALRDAVTGDARRVIYVRGRIDLTPLYVNGSPGVVIDVGSYKTIIGGDSNAMIFGGGLRVKNGKQIIIQNIKFHNALSYAPSERPNGNGGIISQVSGDFTEVDAILLETTTYVWIDHCEFADDPWNANNIPNGMMRHDGLVDIKRASNWVTISNSIFRNHNKNSLIGHNDNNSDQDAGKLKTSFICNWFQGTRQRNPRVRYAEVFMLNNLYTDIGSYGIGVGAGAKVIAERNVFINSRAWRHPDGVPNPIGNLQDTVNLFLSGSSFDAVPSRITWSPYSYFNYQSLAIGNVESHVRRTAGTF